jgi:uncharacterized protein (TIGR02598 family)
MLRWVRGCGFSLPEVAIALAVAGIAVISVVGLMPGLLSSEQSSGANTAVTAMATQAVGWVRSQPYYPNTDPTKKDQLPAAKDLYFGQDGNLLTSDGTLSGQPINNKFDPRAAYACHVTQTAITADPNNATAASPGTHCRIVILDFTWPANVQTTSTRNHKTIYATLSGS